MVQLFVDALNTPGTVPNVESAWETFVHNKCTEVLAAALAAYKQEMTSQVKDKIPCEADDIRAAHEKAVDVGLVAFRRETFDLSTKHVVEYLTEFRVIYLLKKGVKDFAACSMLLSKFEMAY